MNIALYVYKQQVAAKITFRNNAYMYDHISQFEPLLPSEAARRNALEMASQLLRLSHQAASIAHPSVMSALRPLLRKMNSYYTNRIEGQHTLPVQIDEALKAQFSGDAATQRKQRLALAHIETEVWAERSFGEVDSPAAGQVTGDASSSHLLSHPTILLGKPS